MFYPQYGPPLQQATYQNSNYGEIFNRRRGVAAEPSNRHEEKESFFHPAFTLVVDALVKKLLFHGQATLE